MVNYIILRANNLYGQAKFESHLSQGQAGIHNSSEFKFFLNPDIERMKKIILSDETVILENIKLGVYVLLPRKEMEKQEF